MIDRLAHSPAKVGFLNYLPWLFSILDTVLRVKEILAWSESEQHKLILAGGYQKVGALPATTTEPAPHSQMRRKKRPQL
ncbi:hypothetical protein J2I47_05560 [Fibrella sp. HMF5335]|uniref:Uncharacterized protein n=1 Tax=Fibrella rubiginis TaxID=2817060 RepID=A0A939K0E6_9BACT|nr:hypothetical protein [Fibrella rubiginis]MBO0936007.1 hypothetical protein [Fibrella rubiginis]